MNQHVHTRIGGSYLVLGMARSGRAVARLLHSCGAAVTVNERRDREECAEEVEALEKQGITVICGGHPLSLLDETWTMIVRNPGIPYDIPFLKEAKSKGIPVVTEVEIGYLLSNAPIIGITGSNGKTTTTTLIYEMLKNTDRSAMIAGNIGSVFSEQVAQANDWQWLVTELSSFQLLGTQKFCPEIGLLLNVYDAHLDYHKTRQHYIASKMKLFANQTTDQIAVFNADHKVTKRLANEVSGQVVFFSQQHVLERGAYVLNDMIMHRDKAGNERKVIRVDDLQLPGVHNLENALAAVTVACEAGANIECVRSVLTTFRGVAHRLQYVRNVNGVRFFNDSKATNGLATQKALEAFTEPIVLIAGGKDRGEHFQQLRHFFTSRLRAIVCYGEIASKMASIARESAVPNVAEVHNLEEAVSQAYTFAKKGDVVLLSPAAASWDQFQSFEQRGDMFINIVHTL